jgi:hypothetical protein
MHIDEPEQQIPTQTTILEQETLENVSETPQENLNVVLEQSGSDMNL